MSDIQIKRAVDMQPEEAASALRSIADKLQTKYHLRFDWLDDYSANMKGAMASGDCSVQGNEVSINVRLGMLAKGFKPEIERAIHQEIDKYC